MEIRKEVTEFLLNVLGVTTDGAPFDPDARLVEDYGVDSAGIFEMILWLEDRFEIRVEPQHMDLIHFATVRNVESYVRKATLVDARKPEESGT